jgi:DNA-binding MarR family transcriptional regulator
VLPLSGRRDGVSSSRGLVSSARDPADGRVRLITRTDRGDAAAEAASLAIAAVERAWRKELGAEAFDTMKQALRQLGRDSFRPTS